MRNNIDIVIKERNNPTVSVIIPTYNRAHFLPRAVNSVLNQTYQDFEIIIVDDCSTDNTEEIVKNYNNKKIKYIRHDKNRGASAARNTGIKNSSGILLSFLDSDDQWLQHKLECEVRVLNENKNCIICSTEQTIINENNSKIISRHIFEKQFVSQKIALRGECSTTNDFTVVKKAVVDIEGFDEKLPARQDWDFLIRITSIGPGVQVPINTVNKYTMRNDQISTGINNKLTCTIMLYEKHKNLFLADSLALYRILYTIALMNLLNNNYGEAVNYFKKSYKSTKHWKKRVKLTFILSIMKIFGGTVSKVLTLYYKLFNPNSYFFW